jgi:hypothetical protein
MGVNIRLWWCWARELYTRFHLCGACQGAVTLAEQLSAQALNGNEDRRQVVSIGYTGINSGPLV